MSWSWEQEFEDFPEYTPPTAHIHEWEFHQKSSSENGESDTLAARASIELTNAIDELVFIARQVGVPLKHRSDYVRWACGRAVEELRLYLRDKKGIDVSSNTERFIIDSQMMLKRRYRSAEFVRVRNRVEEILKTLNEMIPVNSDGYMKEYDQAVNEINSFMDDVASLKDDFMKRFYIRTLLSRPRFIKIIEELEEKGYVLSSFEQLKELPERVDRNE